jgi:hypothetical protein
MEGIVRNVYEIFEIIMAVTILLLIGGAILFVADSENLQARATASEVSYISTLISKSNIIAELNYDDTIIQSNPETIKIVYKNNDNFITKKYIGGEVKIIEVDKEKKYRLCSGKTCDYLSSETQTTTE